MGIIEWIGVVSGIMAILGLPGLLTIIKWNKLSISKSINKSKVIEEELNSFRKKQDRLINTEIKFKLNTHNNKSKYAFDFDHLFTLFAGISIIASIYIAIFYTEYVNNKFGFLGFIKYNGIKWTVICFLLYMILCAPLYAVSFILSEAYTHINKKLIEKRRKYYSFLYDRLVLDNCEHYTKLGD
jgi:hypothetical protein